MSGFSKDSAVFGHVSPETARVVDDYPYGRRLRCTIRYWVETVPGKGDRFVSQTCNPTTGRWNNPKKSTYSPIVVMFIDPETGYTRHASVSPYSQDEWITTFLAAVGDNLLPTQRAALAGVIGVKRAMEGVTFHVVAGGLSAEQKAEQARTEAVLVRRISGETAAAAAELG